ncbi:MAG: sulfotransferase domain-containing protein [Desulfobacteraceae bacterium]|nr:sulfotransferase domain-containing protein [Desulfobacteraceae bacterium]MBC2754897.1 sulfotransferase domain-containing protein [Desulfobacteraceae bacterium]
MVLSSLFKKKQQPETGLPTIFHITHYKAGSQWVYAVLGELGRDRIITPEAGAAHVTRQPIVPGSIYPCVYLPAQEFRELALPEENRIFIIIRDLRDTLVSLYFSVRHSHQIMNPAMQKLRDTLAGMEMGDGLIYLMDKRLHVSAEIQRSWINDGNGLLIRYEELIQDQYAGFKRILSYCGFDDHEMNIEAAISAHSFEKISGRKPGEESVLSHHRKGVSGDWKNYFDDQVKKVFKERFGELLILTGYEKDDQW